MAKTVQINIVGNPAQAIAALEQVGIKAEETAAKTDRIGKASSGSLSKMQGFANGASIAVLAAGAGAIDVANKLEDSHAALASAVKASGGSMTALAGPLAKTNTAMEQFGFTNAQTESALATMTIGLQNPTKAMDLMGLAANIARARHVDLATAATLVVKASEGQTMALRRAGIDLPVLASNSLKVMQAQTALQKAQAAVNAVLTKAPDAANPASKAHTAYEKALGGVSAAQTKLTELQSAGGQVIDALSQRYGGQAAAAADTFSGRMQVARARVEDVGARVGMALIPALEKLANIVASVVSWFDKHRTLAIALAIEIGALAASLMGLSVALFIIDANPVTLIILGVAAAVVALTVGIYELATHWSEVWNGIQQVVGDAWKFIDGNFIQPIEGFFSSIVGFIEQHWQLILSIITGPIGAAIIWITTHFQTVIDFFTGIPGALATAFTDIGKAIANGFIFGINAVIDAWDWVMDHLRVPKIDIGPIHLGGQDLGGPLKIGHIPYLATGGLITAEGLAFIHAGERIVPAAQVATGSNGGSNSSSQSAGGDLVMVVNGRELARVAGPDVRTWLLQGPSRNARRVGLA